MLKSLGGRSVPISTFWRKECRLVSVLLSDCHRVVTIPSVTYRLLDSMWHVHRLLQGRFSWVGLANTDIVQCLQIYRASWICVPFSCYYQSMAPCEGSVWRNFLQNPQGYIFFYPFHDPISPVNWYECQNMDGCWNCIFLYMKLQRFSMHQWEWLVLACVEGGRPVIIE